MWDVNYLTSSFRYAETEMQRRTAEPEQQNKSHACATAASLIISAYIWVLLGAAHQASVQARALHT
jgi:hypothetical protein